MKIYKSDKTQIITAMRTTLYETGMLFVQCTTSWKSLRVILSSLRENSNSIQLIAKNKLPDRYQGTKYYCVMHDYDDNIIGFVFSE